MLVTISFRLYLFCILIVLIEKTNLNKNFLLIFKQILLTNSLKHLVKINNYKFSPLTSHCGKRESSASSATTTTLLGPSPYASYNNQRDSNGALQMSSTPRAISPLMKVYFSQNIRLEYITK